jgi:hypothetical protein
LPHPAWARSRDQFALLQKSFLSVHHTKPALVREESAGDLGYDELSSSVLGLVLSDDTGEGTYPPSTP